MTDITARHIVMVGPYDFPIRNAAAQLADATAAALIGAGHRVHIIGRRHGQEASDGVKSLESGATLELVGQTSTPGSLIQQLRTASAAASVARQSRGSIVIAYNASSVLLVCLLLVIPFCGGTLIGHSTEWHARPRLSARSLKPIIKRLDIALRMRLLHRMTAGLIVSSTYLASYYASKPSLVVPTLSTLQAKDIASEGTSRLIPRLIYAGIPFAVGTGQLEPKEMKDRLDLAIDALALLADRGLKFEFVVFGISAEQYLEAVPRHRRVVDDGENWLSFPGRVTPKELEREYSEADFSILVRDPVRTTLAGSPTKLTESILLGVIPIVSDVGDANLYVEHMVSGLLLPPDLLGISRILESAILLGVESRRSIRDGVLRSRNGLLPDAWSQRLASFIQQCADGQGP